MEEKKLSYKELEDLMEKISETMKLSEKKEKEIELLDEELHEETRILRVEEGKQKLEQLKMEKEEFDEMTKSSLVYSKEQILIIREKAEKQYQEMLLNSLKKQEDIDKRLQSMKSRGLSEQSLRQAEASAEKARNKEKQTLMENQTKHFEQRAKIDEFEKNLEEYALKLGIEDQLRSVTISEPTTAPTVAPTTAPIVAPTTAPTVEPTTAPTVAPTTAPTVEPTTAPTVAPTTAPTVAPTTAPTVEPTTAPTVAPTTAPTVAPTTAPTVSPTIAPIIDKSEIIIGRKSKIIIDGKKYKLNKETVMEGARLTDEEKLEMIQSNHICENYLAGKTEEEQKQIIENLDGAVICSIFNAGYETENEEELEKIDYLMYNYVSGIENAKQGKKANFSVKYNMKDLAKINLFRNILGSEVNEKDKLEMRKYAKKYERYGLAEEVGTYKRGFLSKIIGKITKQEPMKLATREDEEIAARTYNELRDKNQTQKLRDSKFLEDLKVDIYVEDENGKRDYKDANDNETRRKQELYELYESQEKQENEFYFDDPEEEEER